MQGSQGKKIPLTRFPSNTGGKKDIHSQYSPAIKYWKLTQTPRSIFPCKHASISFFIARIGRGYSGCTRVRETGREQR